ncbi:MAG: DUF6036 family nucleotidyltransferase [Candidatus Limnocylindria bacterium]
MADLRTSFDDALATLGALLAERGLRYELYAVGGGALQLLGLIRRPTKDIDVAGLVEDGVITPPRPMPAELMAAVVAVAELLDMSDDWMNAGPASLLDLGLPKGALERAVRREWQGLVLYLAGRTDQISFKLYAAVDQGPDSKHFSDLRQLEPTTDELLTAGRWARTHDPSDAFRDQLVRALGDLGVSDADV